MGVGEAMGAGGNVGGRKRRGGLGQMCWKCVFFPLGVKHLSPRTRPHHLHRPGFVPFFMWRRFSPPPHPSARPFSGNIPGVTQMCLPAGACCVGYAGLDCLLQTVRFKNELERNITIKLGYANAKIFKAVEGAVPGPGNFRFESRTYMYIYCICITR